MAFTLRLRPLRLEDESAFLHAQRVMHEHDDYQFGLFYAAGMPFAEYLTELEERRTRQVTNETVGSTFLVAEVDNRIVGRVSIRHGLNDFLRRYGGHIGYCVLPDDRRCGYATQILRQSLAITSAMGLDRVMLTCDDDNIGSITVIESCGGLLTATVAADDPPRATKRHYWIG